MTKLSRIFRKIIPARIEIEDWDAILPNTISFERLKEFIERIENSIENKLYNLKIKITR